MTNPLKIQIGGKHYRDFKIQPVEFIYANNIPFLITYLLLKVIL